MQRGFSLLEVLVATSVLVAGVVALAQLVVLAARANLQARQTTFTAVLAQQKMEELLPEAAGLIPSPTGAIGRNVEGYSDFVDRRGIVLGGGPTPPPDSAYLRRWSIEPLPNSANGMLILQVLVTDLRNRGAADATTAVSRLPGEARLVAAKARKAF